jgi:uncharacterized membrane protein YphA (DoxX/SURF4 family)
VLVELSLGCRWLLGTVLLFAGITKLRAVETVYQTVQRYVTIPPVIGKRIARSLPPIEVGLGALLVIGVLPHAAAAAAAPVVAIFAAVVAWNVARGRSFYCGCGLGQPQPIGWPLVVRNALLLIAAVVVAAEPASPLAVVPDGAISTARPIDSASFAAVPLIVLLLLATVRFVERTDVVAAAKPIIRGRPDRRVHTRGTGIAMIRVAVSRTDRRAR